MKISPLFQPPPLHILIRLPILRLLDCRLLSIVIGSKGSRHFFNELEAELRQITPSTNDFSRPLSKLQVISRTSEWFIALFAPLVIGWSNYFGIGISTVI